MSNLNFFRTGMSGLIFRIVWSFSTPFPVQFSVLPILIAKVSYYVKQKPVNPRSNMPLTICSNPDCCNTAQDRPLAVEGCSGAQHYSRRHCTRLKGKTDHNTTAEDTPHG
jgi:hypothetical protein